MQISITNDYGADGTLTVLTDNDANQTKANLEDPSFSTKYTSAGSASTFNIEKTFATPGIDVGYVAIFGHNLSDFGGDVTVVVKVDGVTKDTITVSSTDGNHVIMSTFTEVSGALDIDVEITKVASGDQVTITGIAAGKYLDVPNGGEQAGYPRTWLTRNKRQRVTSDSAAGPVAIVSQSFARRVSLNVRAATLTFIEGSDWNSLLDLAFNDGYLFIKEHDGSISGISDDPLSSLMAFEIEIPPPTAHPQTRQYVGFSINFRAYTGV